MEMTNLVKACRDDQEEEAMTLLQNKYVARKINKTSESGCTALHHACMNKNMRLITALLEVGAQILIKNHNNDTAFDLSSTQEMKQALKDSFVKRKIVVRLKRIGYEAYPGVGVILDDNEVFYSDIILSKGDDQFHLKIDGLETANNNQTLFQKPSNFKFTSLHYNDIVSFQTVEELEAVLKEKSEKNWKKQSEQSIFRMAFNISNYDYIKVALSLESVSQSFLNNNGFLFSSCEQGHTNIVKLLIDINTKDMPNQNGYTPLNIACLYNHNSLVALLLNDYRCNPNIVTEEGVSPLAIACKNSNVDLVSLLLEKGADILHQDALGNRPINYAISEEIEYILKTKILQNRVIPSLESLGYHIAQENDMLDDFDLIFSKEGKSFIVNFTRLDCDNDDIELLQNETRDKLLKQGFNYQFTSISYDRFLELKSDEIENYFQENDKQSPNSSHHNSTPSNTPLIGGQENAKRAITSTEDIGKISL